MVNVNYFNDMVIKVLSILAVRSSLPDMELIK